MKPHDVSNAPRDDVAFAHARRSEVVAERTTVLAVLRGGWPVPVAGGALAAAIVLNDFARWIEPLSHLTRPLLTLAGGGAILGLLILLLLRRPGLAMFVALPLIGGILRPAVAVQLGLPALFVIVLQQWLRARGSRHAQRILGPAASLTLLMTLAVMLQAAISAAQIAQWPPPATATSPPARTPSRDLVLILLDGYPRADSLAGIFGIDNEPFLAELEALGFDVYRKARTEHDQTPLSLMALLAGEDSSVPAYLEYAVGYREVRAALPHQPALTALRAAGWEFVYVPPPFGAELIEGADRTVEFGSLTEYEVNVITLSAVADLVGPGPLLDSLRAHLRDSLEAVPDLAASADAQLVLVHVLAPHPPFLFESDGTPTTDSPCWTECYPYSASIRQLRMDKTTYAEAMRAQLDALNRMLLTTVEGLIRQSPDTAVVLFGDHGMRFDGDAHNPNRPERFHEFLAARTPGHLRLFGEHPTLASLLPGLFEAYSP